MSTQSFVARMRGGLVVLSLLAAPAALSAQAAPALPAAGTIIADYVKAMGGRAAFDKLQSLHMSGTFSMPAMNANGTVETFASRPNLTYIAVNLPGFGDILSGSNGTVAWSVNPFNGASVLSGAELTNALEDATFAQTVRDSALFASATTVEKTTLDGRECYKVKFMRKGGRETFDCFSTETKLLVGSIDKAATAQGDVETITIVRGYKPFEGVMIPMELLVSAAGMEQVITITKVDAAVPATRFELPEQIKAIVK